MGIDQSSLQQFDLLIRSGKGNEVRHQLKRLDLKGVADNHRRDLADICRRVGMPNTGLKILTPLLKSVSRPEALPQEMQLIYGILMIDIGVTSVGASLLARLDHRKVPKALLYQAIGHFHRWENSMAAPLLREYVVASEISDYERVIGRLNLAAALVGLGQFSEAEEILNSLITEAREKSHQLVLGSSLELLGQIKCMMRDFAHARSLLFESVEVLKSTFVLPALWARKWLAIVEMFENGDDGPLKKIRVEALERSDFETVRDCDLFTASISKDQQLVNYIYFGTSFFGYRKRMKFILGDSLTSKVPHSFRISREQNPVFELDLFSGKFLRTSKSQGSNSALEFASQSHELMVLLASDAYRPIRVGSIFMHLFPGELFDPTTSPSRVYMAVNRLRKLAADRDLSFQISQVKGQFRLVTKGISLFYDHSLVLDDFVDLTFERIRNKFSDNGFCTKDIETEFRLDLRAAQRRIKKYRQLGLIESHGAGRNSRYYLSHRSA